MTDCDDCDVRDCVYRDLSEECYVKLNNLTCYTFTQLTINNIIRRNEVGDDD